MRRPWPRSPPPVTMISGSHKEILKSYYPAISAPVFSPDGKVLLAADGDKVRRYEVASGGELPAFEVEGSWLVRWCLPAAGGQTLALVCWGNPEQILVLDAASGKVRRRLEEISQPLNQAALSPDGRTIAIDQRNEVWLWEVASGRPRGRLPGVFPVFSLAFSSEGR